MMFSIPREQANRRRRFEELGEDQIRILIATPSLEHDIYQDALKWLSEKRIEAWQSREILRAEQIEIARSAASANASAERANTRAERANTRAGQADRRATIALIVAVLSVAIGVASTIISITLHQSH